MKGSLCGKTDTPPREDWLRARLDRPSLAMRICILLAALSLVADAVTSRADLTRRQFRDLDASR
jgi:hypothetical protein